MKPRSIYAHFMSILALSVLTGCPDPSLLPNTEQSLPTPQASDTPAQSSASPSVSSPPSAVPSADLTAPPVQVTPSSAPTDVPQATASPSGVILPTPTSDISTIESTTFNGKVYDDTNAPLDGVTITVRSLNQAVPYSFVTQSVSGSFSLNNAPAGVQIEIIASKPGYTTRRRVEVLKSNKQGDPNANRYDFGTDGSPGSTGTSFNALSDLPEVTAVTPRRNSGGNAPKSQIVLFFSEPMDRDSVEKTFAIYSFNNRQVTADVGNTSRSNTFTGNSDVSQINGTDIWDNNAFDIDWNEDDTEATFSFKEEKQLPSDKESSRVPDFQLAFQSFGEKNRIIKDKTGVNRSKNHFKTTDGPFEESLKFSILTDELTPKATTLVAETDENAGIDGDSIRLVYSEPMIYYFRGISQAGGMDNISGADRRAPAAYPGGTVATGKNTAKNYQVKITGSGGKLVFNGTWFALGGTAIYDTADLTHKTVKLLAPKYTGGATEPNIHFNGGELTSAVGGYKTDGNNNNAYVLNFFPIDSGPVNSTITLSNNLANNQAIAADLQTRLNTVANALTPAPSLNPFTVTAAEGNGAITIVFNDTSGKYMGYHFFNTPAATGTDVLPDFKIGGTSITNDTKLDIYEPGYRVTVEIANSVIDPAGNTMDSSKDDASATAS